MCFRHKEGFRNEKARHADWICAFAEAPCRKHAAQVNLLLRIVRGWNRRLRTAIHVFRMQGCLRLQLHGLDFV